MSLDTLIKSWSTTPVHICKRNTDAWLGQERWSRPYCASTMRSTKGAQRAKAAHAFPLVNVMRADEVTGSLPHDEAMRNAPAKAGGLFVVPKIVE